MTVTRRLHLVRNSYYVYLPREWVRRNRLSKNAEIRMEQGPDGALMLFPASVRETEGGGLTISSPDVNPSRIENLLTGAYVIGADSVNIVFPEPIAIGVREKISGWIRRLPGFEILDEHSASIVVSDTSEKQMVKPILKRQFATAKYMLNGLVNAMVTGEVSIASKIIARDEDVDRHRYFVERLCHLALQDLSYAKRIAISPSDCLNFSLAAKYVERIADHVCGAASELRAMKTVRPSVARVAKSLTEVYENTTRTFFDIGDGGEQSLSTSDNKAIAVLESAESLAKRLEKMGSSRREKSPRMVLLLMHLERIASYCADIGEVAINRRIGARIGLGTHE